MSKDEFVKDRKTQQAVLMNIMKIGEVATLLKKEHAAFVTAHAEIEWNKMRGMRNILSHEYWSINLDVVWQTVTKSIPDLVAKVRALKAN